MKLKNSRNLDARQTLLLDSAAYAARPPERLGARRKRRPPMHEYMRHLVHERLTHAELKQARPAGRARTGVVGRVRAVGRARPSALLCDGRMQPCSAAVLYRMRGCACGRLLRSAPGSLRACVCCYCSLRYIIHMLM